MSESGHKSGKMCKNKTSALGWYQSGKPGRTLNTTTPCLCQQKWQRAYLLPVPNDQTLA